MSRVTEWEFKDGEWCRDAGRFRLVVWEQNEGWPWQVEYGNTLMAIGRRRECCVTLEIAKTSCYRAAMEIAYGILHDLKG